MLAASSLIAFVLSAGAAPLTLADALGMADAQNPELVGERLQAAVIAADVEAAGALPNPIAGVSYGPDDPKLFGTVEQRLPFFGQRGTAIDAARAEQRAGAAHLEWTRARVRAEVRRTYFALAAAESRVKVSERLSELAEKLSDATRKRYEVGTAAQLDAEQAQLNFEKTRQDAVDAQADVRDARARLALLLGRSDAGQLSAADPLYVDQPAPKAGELTSHPEVVFNQAEVEAAKARATRERAAVIPVPSVSLELQRLDATPVPGLRVGLSFDLPLLSWNRGPIHRAEAEASLFESEQRAALTRLSMSRSAAAARVEVSRERAKLYYERLIPQARKVEQLAQLSYSVGKAPLAAVLQAESELANDEAQAISSALELQRALADLEELNP